MLLEALPCSDMRGRLVVGLVAEEVLEVLAPLLDPDQAELERCRTVADRVVGAVVLEVELERVRARLRVVAALAQVLGEARRPARRPRPRAPPCGR